MTYKELEYVRENHPSMNRAKLNQVRISLERLTMKSELEEFVLGLVVAEIQRREDAV